ncbi:NUDIX hydrolase domain-like protein [Polychytrium aggregatum]|uniref:NUDIX hydrolase domain-like protein n=1 Tax=Polychytrium aggregatum TaxID=110093 RepID=UPI0022FE16FE|nr:NUDIX hydrolase domain-like protein [Polychytrium aggregatum]KAI9203320.1 NUDIX hydrolase domain-like protein [Polychytrium aggregatum]
MRIWLATDTLRDADLEVLYIKRAERLGDRWSGHTAFPGGKQEPGETDIETAIRETQEEIGLDLQDGFVSLGALDDREIQDPTGRTVLMVLCPFVFLQICRATPPLQLQESEVASAHWVPIDFFLTRARQRIRECRYRIPRPLSRLFFPEPRSRHRRTQQAASPIPTLGWKQVMLRQMIDVSVGELIYFGIWLPSGDPAEPADRSRLGLWGITLRITRDLLKNLDDPLEQYVSVGFSHYDMQLVLSMALGAKQLAGFHQEGSELETVRQAVWIGAAWRAGLGAVMWIWAGWLAHRRCQARL